MTKLLALLFLFLIAMVNMVANLWLTFGIWPIRWWPVAVFAITGALLQMALGHIAKKDA